jgi:hypothetical protein
LAKEEQLFHTVEEEKLKDIVRGSYLLSDTIMYDEIGIKNIPAFVLEEDIKGFKSQRWHVQKDVVLHVAIGKEYKSYFVFIITNKHGEEMRFSLPMEDHAPHLPSIMMTGEVRIAKNNPKYETKGDRKKNIFTVKLSDEVREVFRYGLLLFMDKSGMLNRSDSKALTLEETEIEFTEEKTE